MTKHKSSFWHQMHTEGKISHKQFALCLLNERVASRDGTHAGVMTLGGSDTRLHKSQMIFAEESRSPKQNYHVYIEKIYLSFLWNSTTATMQSMIEIPLSDKKIITAMIDSGTTDTYFSSAVKKPFRKEWRNLMGFDYDSFLPAEEQDRLPTIVLQLRGRSSNSSILVGIPPLNYVSSSTKKKLVETHVHMGSGSTITLGANFMSGYDVLFDVENNCIGFAPSDCQLPATPTSDESISGTAIDKNAVHQTNINNSSSITVTTKNTIGSSNNSKNITKQITPSKNVKNKDSSVTGGITKPTEDKDTSYTFPKNKSNTTENSKKHAKSNTTLQKENSSLSLKDSKNYRGFALSLFVLFVIGGFLIVAILAFVLRSTTMEESEEEDERGNTGESNPLISAITTNTNTNAEENDSSQSTNNIVV